MRLITYLSAVACCTRLALAGEASTLDKVLDAYNNLREMKRTEETTRRITRLDADSLHEYDVLAYHLNLSVQADPAPLEGMAEVSASIREAQDTLWLNAQGLTISQVTTSEGVRAFIYRNDLLGIAGPWIVGDTTVLFITYTAPVSEGYLDTGFHYGYHLVFTFAEPYGARQWFPCYDEPFDKASETSISLEMPQGWHLASNGRLDSVSSPSPDRAWESYQNHNPICTYLVSIAAAPYARWYAPLPGGGQVRYFAFRNDSESAVYDWERTPQMIAQFTEQFGPYPFDDYGMSEADLFGGWGAMEHQTFTTMGYHLIDSARTYEGIVAHELAHQWFGDALSPVDFRHIWLNEGFASYGNALWYEEAGEPLEFENFLNAMAESYFAEDRQVRYALFDPPEDYLFGTAIYFKGAWVLHMLRRQIMGDSLFFEALRTYTSRFLYGNVSTNDFQAVCEEVSGQDLDWFFNQWVYQAGFPVLDIGFAFMDTSLQVTVRQLQENAPQAFRIPITFYVETHDGVTQHTSWFSQREETQFLTTAEPITGAGLTPSQPLLYQGTGASVPDREIVTPVEMSLGQNWPNPFNSSTSFSLSLSRMSAVELTLYNLLGERVTTLARGTFPAGTHRISFDAPSSLSSGSYFVVARAGDFTAVRRVVLLK
jgi:aminopeptidase N